MKGERDAEEIYIEHDITKNDHEFEKIVDHTFKEGVLILKARYQNNTIGEYHILDVPFDILKKDAPIQ
eukprot:8522724-Ditylum_brightwellii.AAC.1